MLYHVQPLACIVPLVVLLTGCATSPPPLVDVKAPARGCNEPPLVYPDEARRARAEGRVVVSAVIEADGTVSEAKISESSGNALLDGTALRSVQAIKCAPFKDPETGPAMRVSFSKPFIFSMDGTPIRTAALFPGMSAATLDQPNGLRVHGVAPQPVGKVVRRPFQLLD